MIHGHVTSRTAHIPVESVFNMISKSNIIIINIKLVFKLTFLLSNIIPTITISKLQAQQS